MRKYTIVLIVLFLVTFVVACTKVKEPYEVKAPLVEKYTRAEKYYTINSFNRETKAFDKVKMQNFIASIENHFETGDIISIDGLKWVKMSSRFTENEIFTPFPNPPIPVYEAEKEHVSKHVQEYGQWIIDHPHFGYPPLPMMNR